MEEHLHNSVDKLFRDSLRFHKEEPGEDLWERIGKNLDAEDQFISISRRRRIYRIAAGLVLLLTGAGLLTLNYFKGDTFKTEKYIQSNGHTPVVDDQAMENNPPGQETLPVPGTKVNSSQSFMNSRFRIPTRDDLNILTSRNRYIPVSSKEDPPAKYDQDSIFSDLSYSTVPAPHVTTFQIPESKLTDYDMKNSGLQTEQQIPDKMIIKSEKHPVRNRLSITAFFSQEFAGYNLSDNDVTAAHGKEIENRERTVFSASVGTYLNYRINKRWVFQTGLSYSWSSSHIDSSKSFAVKDNTGNVYFKMNTISGYGYLKTPAAAPPNPGDSVLTDKAFSQLHYLTVPLILSYRVPLKRFTLLAGAGVSINMLTSAQVETKIYGPNVSQDESKIPIKGLKKVNYGMILKADLGYRINSRLGIDLISSFENALSPINMHSALSTYPYNFGIGLGVSYYF
jgi:hypothetical protein